MNEDRVFDLLGLIARRAPNSDAAQDAFEQVQAENPGRKSVDPAQVEEQRMPVRRSEPRHNPEDLHTRLEDDLRGTLQALRYRPSDSSSSDEDYWAKMSSLSHSIKEHPQDGVRLLGALCDSVDAASANADRGITTAVLDAWREAAFTLDDIEPIARLLDRVASVGEQHWSTDANFSAYSGVDWLTRSINDWTGKSAMVWMTLPRWVDADDVTELSNALEAMQRGLTRLLDLDGDPRRLAIATIGSRLNLLFAVAPEWATATVLPLFDATTNVEHAHCAWSGYLYSASGSQQLLSAGLLEHYLSLAPASAIATPQDPLSEMRAGPTGFRRGINRHLAEISLFSGINPQQHGWLSRYISAVPVDWRTTWALDLSSGLSAMTVAARSAQWHSWIRDYLFERTAGRPLTLDPAEASELAEWSRYFDAEFPEFVELILTWPRVPLRKFSRLMHSMAKLGEESGDDADSKVDVAARHPDEAARLLAHLLSASDKQELHQSTSAYLVHQAASRLRDHADTPAWQELEHELLRLGIKPDGSSS